MARFLTPWRLVAAGVVALLVALAALVTLPSEKYIFLPSEANALAPLVRVQGERPSRDGGGIYYVTVDVRKASLLEQLFPGIHEGSTLVPESQVIPPGSDEQRRRRGELREMARSQKVAAAVALRELGYDVPTRSIGAIVVGTSPDGPAAGKLQPNEIIVAADGEPVRSPDDLRRLVGRREPGETVTLRVRDGDRLRQVVLRTVRSPNDPGRPIVGVFVEPAVEVRLPLNVQIDLGNVGGPSAGLAFALDILEELGRDVDRGYKIAATGEIRADGSVGSIGGVKQKAIAARRSDVDVFVVPAGANAREAREHAGDVRVVAVETFQQALRDLTTLPPKGQED